MAIVQTDTVTRQRDGADDLTDIPVQLKWPANPYEPIEAYGRRVDCVMLTDPDTDILRNDIVVRTEAFGHVTLRGTNEWLVTGMEERGSPVADTATTLYYLEGV